MTKSLRGRLRRLDERTGAAEWGATVSSASYWQFFAGVVAVGVGLVGVFVAGSGYWSVVGIGVAAAGTALFIGPPRMLRRLIHRGDAAE